MREDIHARTARLTVASDFSAFGNKNGCVHSDISILQPVHSSSPKLRNASQDYLGAKPFPRNLQCDTLSRHG